MDALKLNERAAKVAQSMADRSLELGLVVHDIGGARVIDAGVKAAGSLGAGLELARVCLADLAMLNWSTMNVGELSLPSVTVEVRQPVAACMASQYAGWQVSVDTFFAMASGPMRAVYGKETIYDHIGHREVGSNVAVGVLETGKLPTAAVVQELAQKCNVTPAKLTLVVARTASLAGGVQVVARSVETAMHKLHTLGFDLNRVVAGFGETPLPPVAKDDLSAIGRTNDAVLYGGQVTLMVRGDDASLEKVCGELPASASKDYGRPFGEIFASYHHDFYKIDPLLFSPAMICLQNIDSGRTFRAGRLDHDILTRSFMS